MRSGFGLHLVRISRVAPGGVPPLAEIRDQVARAWQHARRREAEELFYQALRERWTVEIERGAPAPPAAAATGRMGADARAAAAQTPGL